MQVVRDAQDGLGLLRFVDGCNARAEAQFPAGKLHIGGGLAQIEGDGPARGVGRYDGYRKCGPGQVPGVPAELRKPAKRLSVAGGDEVPGLRVLGGLRPAPGVENGAEGLFRDHLIGEDSSGALGADGFGNVHVACLLRLLCHAGEGESNAPSPQAHYQELPRHSRNLTS